MINKTIHNMRRNKFIMSDDDIKSLLIKGEYGVLSLSCGNDFPYCVPLNYVYKDNSIYIHCAKNAGYKLECIKNNPKVCFNVLSDIKVLPDKFVTAYRSVNVFGMIVQVFENAEKRRMLETFIEKYSSDYIDGGIKYINTAIEDVSVFKIIAETITGKARQG